MKSTVVRRKKKMSKTAIINHVKEMADRIHGTFRIATTGTPHILYTGKTGITSSICYFAHSDTWKVFWPWNKPGVRTQSRVFTEAELIKAIKPIVTVHNIKGDFVLRDKDGRIIYTNNPYFKVYATSW